MIFKILFAHFNLILSEDLTSSIFSAKRSSEEAGIEKIEEYFCNKSIETGFLLDSISERYDLDISSLLASSTCLS